MRFKSFTLRRGRYPSSADERVVRDLMLGVWGVRLGTKASYSSAYLHHCNELRRLFEEDGFENADRQDIIELVNVIRADNGSTVKELTQTIKAASPGWASSIQNDDCLQNLLDFAVRLWLFVEPDLSDRTLKLSEVIQQCLPPPNALRLRYEKQIANRLGARHNLLEPDDFWFLSRDFSEKSLTRKAAIKLEWTSYLPDHLTFVGKTRLRIFRHASAIQAAARSPRDLPYPAGFLDETERTLALLFDPASGTTSKRTRRIESRHHVDLEAAMKSVVDSNARFDLRNYPYWQERLHEIQRIYDETQPKSLKQWLFDRRNRFNWATFWVALVVFALTVVFGIISSVTGIMQVVAAFRGSSYTV